MISADKTTEIFYLIDEFSKEFEKVAHGSALQNGYSNHYKEPKFKIVS
jgi:hypothetical protein